MTTMRIAVPSQTRDGLASQRSEHFGHCEFFTLVDFAGDTVTRVQHIDNVVHGSCMMPVKLLQDFEVNALIVSGIGAKPLQGFAQAGIAVFFAPRLPYGDVNSLMEGMARQEFSLMDPGQACKGHGHCRSRPFEE